MTNTFLQKAYTIHHINSKCPAMLILGLGLKIS